MATLVSLWVVYELAVNAADFEPLGIRKLIRKLTAGLAPGTFMVS